MTFEPAQPTTRAARLRRARALHRTARAEGSDSITCLHLLRTCELEGLDEHGLDQTEQKYLRLLAQANGKPVRLSVISSILGLPNQTITSVTEKFLLRAGLVVRCENGRALTERGAEYADNGC